MNQYTLPARERLFLMICMIVGIVCMGITYFTDDALHSRFWSNFLHNSVFFTGIAFLAIFFLCANVIAFSGWYTVFKRVWEAYAQFLIVGIGLMAVVLIGLWSHSHHLYHWADAAAVEEDAILQHKSALLNPVIYLVTLLIVGIWYFMARKIRSISLEEEDVDKFDFKVHKRKLRIWAAAFLPIGGFTSPIVIWLWIMSIDAHWYSTLFAWYCTISWFVTMLCCTILALLYLKGKGYFAEVTHDHFHDLGKYVFGFSIFWTYLWFSQYMLIWYGNVGEETIYYKQRLTEYPVLFYANLVINFLLPFFVLMRNDTKRKEGTLTLITIVLIIGHWLDYFLMLKPGILHTAHEVLGVSHEAAAHAADHAHEAGAHAEHAAHAVAGFSLPGFLEIGTFIGFAALFAYCFLVQLQKAPLVAYRDPYIEESLHHHVV